MTQRCVWILNQYAQPPDGMGGVRHFGIAQGLRERGWRATIIAGSVELNSRRPRIVRAEQFVLENFDGIPFLWIRVPDASGSLCGRAWGMASFAFHALRRGAARGLDPPDAVVGSSVHPLSGLAAAILARRYGVPFLFEVRDLWPETLIALGNLRRNGPVARAMRLLEGNLYRRATRIITVLPYAATYIVSFGVEPIRVVWVPNGVSTKRFNAAPREPDDGPLRLCYLGAHGRANDLETLVDAMGQLQARGLGRAVHLRLYGEGPRKAGLVARATRLGLQNVSFEAAVESRDVPRIAAEADAFVITVLNRPGLYRYGVSMNKLFDYMAAGRPVVIAMDAPSNPIQEACAGITVAPEDAGALADGIERLLSLSAEARRKLGENGRRYVELNHDFGVLAAKFAAALDESVAQPSRVGGHRAG